MFEKDSDDFPIKCDACGEEFNEKVGRIKSGFDSRCPNPACGLRITHPAEQFRRLLENRNDEMPTYLRRFMRLPNLK